MREQREVELNKETQPPSSVSYVSKRMRMGIRSRTRKKEEMDDAPCPYPNVVYRTPAVYQGNTKAVNRMKMEIKVRWKTPQHMAHENGAERRKEKIQQTRSS